MKELKKLASNEYNSLSEVATEYGFESPLKLMDSDLVIYIDQSLSGLMSGIGMDQNEFINSLDGGADSLGYSNWSLYYLKRHNQYILLNNFY